jgi:HME family heavy-metal exporter
MFSWLIRISLLHAQAVVISAGLLLALAGWLIPKMAVDVFPELNAPTVVIMTEAGGLAADEVEQYITVPLEAAVNGMPGMRKLRSSSALGLSFVWIEFDWGEDIWRARQQVAERLSAIEGNLPTGAHAEIAPVTSITGEVMLLSVSSPDGSRNPQEIRSFAEFELTNRLLGVPGIAQVVAIGGELPEYQVLCRPERLRQYGLTVSQVVEAASKAHSTASAGYLPNRAGKEVPIRQAAQVATVADIQRSVVTYHAGTPVTIGDVAEVVLAAAPSRGAAADNGRMAVIISVQKAPGTNTLTLTQDLDTALANMAVPNGMAINSQVFRQAEFIQLSVDNLIKVLYEAAIIVAVVLVLFLLNARTTIITLTALPLSLAAAFLVMEALGMSINVMTLGGLAVALGGLVDDAIIDVENVFRRLRGLPNQASSGERVAMVEQASNEIRAPMVFATVIIILVFVPLLFLSGIEGRFFRPLGMSYIVSTLASLVVAVTVTPALCRLLLARRPLAHGDHDGFLVRWLKHLYVPTLAWCLRWRRSVVVGSLALAAVSLGLASTFGSSFLPAFKEGSWQVQIMMPPGTSLEESDRLVRGVETRLAEIPGVRNVARRTGRAERDQHAEPPSASELNITVAPGAQDQVRIAMDALLAQMPGVVTAVGQPIEHRLSHILSGTPAAIAITVFGDDLDRLRRIAQDIEGALKKQVPGARDVVANREVMVETLPLRYRHEDLARAGLTPAEAAEQVEAAIAGVRVATINQGLRRYDLTVRLHPDERQNETQLGELVLTSPHGPQVRLREIADLGIEMASNLIAREGARRKAVVSCNVADGHNLGDLVQAVRQVVDPLVAQAGLTVHYGGQFEAQQEASRSIALMGLAVTGVIFLLLAAALSSAKAAALVMLNLPLALIGGIAAIYIAESPSLWGNTRALFGLGGAYTAPVLSIASLVGFITLFGIAVRNGILLINQYQHLLTQGHSVNDAITLGSRERLVAILMTAITAVIGLLPLALMQGQPGAEILAPLAIVVLGGLVTSTALNLVVVPAAYAWVFDRATPTQTSPAPAVITDPDNNSRTNPPARSAP